MNTKLLDFLVIGAPRSGTTSLFQYLKHHPKIYVPPDKERPFFVDDKIYSRGWDAFAEKAFWNAPSHLLWGKITPPYMRWDIVPPRIFHTMPHVKLIALLRNPVERAFSHYTMEVRYSREHRSCEDAFSSVFERPDSDKPYLMSGQYGRVLQEYLRYFPKEQLLVHFTDDLEKDPQMVFDSICLYLGLEPGFSPPNTGKRYNVGGKKQRFPSLISNARKISPLRWLWKNVPLNQRRRIWFWFDREINVVRHGTPKMNEDLRKRLLDFYRQDVRDLEVLLGKKVPWTEFHEI